MAKRVWMTAMAACLCMSVFSSPVWAEASADDEIMQELYGGTTPVSTGELVGDEIYLNEMRSVPDYYLISVASAEFTNEVTAEEPAEDSMRITPSAGNTCLDVKLVYRHGQGEGVTIDPAFRCGINVGGDTDYKGRLLIEAASNDGNYSWHENDPKCLETNANAYLVNVENSAMPAVHPHNGSASRQWYFLYHYVVQIPQEYATDNTPVYVTIALGESQFYYQVK